MSDYWWCLTHQRVESGENVCRARDRLGPYRSEQEAAQALDSVARRNAEWDAEDDRWHRG